MEIICPASKICWLASLTSLRGAPVVYPPTLHRFVLGPISGAVRIASIHSFIHSASHSFIQSVSQPFIRSSIYRTAYPRIPSFLPLQIQCGVKSSSFSSTHHPGPFSHPHLFKGLWRQGVPEGFQVQLRLSHFLPKNVAQRNHKTWQIPGCSGFNGLS